MADLCTANKRFPCVIAKPCHAFRRTTAWQEYDDVSTSGAERLGATMSRAAGFALSENMLKTT